MEARKQVQHQTVAGLYTFVHPLLGVCKIQVPQGETHALCAEAPCLAHQKISVSRSR